MNVTSDAAVEPYEGWGVYGTTKAALDHLGAVLAAENPGVRVLTLDPGDMRTRMHQDAFPGEDISDRPLPEASVPGILALIDSDTPSGRYRVSAGGTERHSRGVAPGGGMTMITTATATTTPTDHAVVFSEPLAFDLPPALEATAPPEITLGRRDAVKLMRAALGTEPPIHTHAYDLARHLDPGDLVVLNTSATVPAAVDAIDHGSYVVVHFSTEMPDGSWLVEVRTPVAGAPRGASPTSASRTPGPRGSEEASGGVIASLPDFGDFTGHRLELPGGATIELRERFGGSVRLWVATLDLGRPVVAYLEQWGRPIRYRYVPATWPIDSYRNVYANEPGSAEMPSAGRPVTRAVLASLEARGVGIATLLLHTGVCVTRSERTPVSRAFPRRATPRAE